MGFSTRGKFDSSPVPYADLWLAASSQYSATVGAARERELEPVRVLRYAPQGNCRLDLDSIRRLLGDFYHATDSRVYEPGEAEAVLQREGLGIEVYGCLQRRLEYSLSHPQFCDFLSFHVLWEHKRCMAERMRFILDHAALPCHFVHQAETLAESAWKLRMMILRYGLNRDVEIVKRALVRLRAMAHDDRLFHEELLADTSWSAA